MGNVDFNSTMWSSKYMDAFAESANDLGCWAERMMKIIDCDEDSHITLDKFKKPNKDVFVKQLFEVFQGVNHYKEIFLNTATKLDEIKSDMINTQKSVIQLQGELLDIKTKELDSVQRTVKTAVENTVQAEIKSYSAAVSKHSPSSASTFTAENLKKVVQNVVAEEDRSRNVLIFGLKEDAGEKLCDKICDVFEQMAEKPRFEAARIGNKVAEKHRAVKVSFGNSSTVHQILIKAKELRLSQCFKTVFISPDRSPEERAVHKQLVLDLKRKVTENPNKRYFIRTGKICEIDE